MIEQSEALDIQLNGTFAGVLVRHQEGTRFRLAKTYIELADRPILGQIFEDRPEFIFRESMGVPRWFGHLLPEGPFRRFISKALDVHEDRSFFLLKALGHDLPGAVVATPRLVNADLDREDLSPQPDESALSGDDDSLKFSLAGMQIKFSMHDSDRGLTLPMRGQTGDWIVKLADRRFPNLPENEYSMMSWAKASGIEVPEVRLTPTDRLIGIPDEYASGLAAFAIKRYDRVDGSRIHAEDFAQIIDVPADRDGKGKYSRANYETVGRILVALAGEGALTEYLKRLAFTVLIGNGDAHLKNWSVIYRDGRHATLSPAYDFVSTVLYPDFRDDKLALNISNNKIFSSVGIGSFERLINRCGCNASDHLPTLLRSMEGMMDAWTDISADLPLNDEHRQQMQQRLASLPLLSSVRHAS